MAALEIPQVVQVEPLVTQMETQLVLEGLMTHLHHVVAMGVQLVASVVGIEYVEVLYQPF